jgi:hypothetical protein
MAIRLPSLVSTWAAKCCALTAYGLRGTNTDTRGWSPTSRVMCPWPVTSSAIRISPGPRRRTVPSPISMSTAPERVKTHTRPGALCQGLERLGSKRRATMPLSACTTACSEASSTGSKAGSTSSKCDLPSDPVKIRMMARASPYGRLNMEVGLVQFCISVVRVFRTMMRPDLSTQSFSACSVMACGGFAASSTTRSARQPVASP